MAFRLIGADCSITVYDGGPQMSFSGAWGAATPLKQWARRISVEDSLETEDVSALGDTRRKLRGKRGSSTVELELLVPSTGSLAIAIGNVVKTEYKANSAFAVPTTLVGLLTRNRLESPDGVATQTLTLECDADDGTTS